MSLTHEKLAEVFPENKDAVSKITSEELNQINQFLDGIVGNIKIPIGSTIRLTTTHTMFTSDAKNEGRGRPLPETAIGYSPDPVPEFPPYTVYGITLAGNSIILAIKEKVYMFYSNSRLRPAAAEGAIVEH